MQFVHINIIARDWKRLSKFYQDVFHCVPVPPERDLSGQWLEDLTGIKDVRIQGGHLLLPGYDGNGPTLEIFSYNEMMTNEKLVNNSGFAHIAFAVDDVQGTLDSVIKNGGESVGKPVIQKYPNSKTGTFVYCRDIEGNIIELQKWE
jgi:predicted enzyme related to lactoylglutathione lyase